MPYVVRDKCVYKKGKDGNPGKKVGCTKGSVKKYLAALHANANESLSHDMTEEKIKEIIFEEACNLLNEYDIIVGCH